MGKESFDVQIEILSPNSLNSHHLSTWSELRDSDPILANPFFDTGFARAVDDVCGNVKIAVLRVGREILGFFPFQTESAVAGLPLGTRVAEIQGAIVRPETEWDPLQILHAAGLKSWAFDCVPRWQQPLSAYQFCVDQFPFISLGDGFESYRLEQRQAGSRQIQQALRKERRLARERGPLRFEMHTDDEAAMEAVWRWKSSQYERTGTFDLFRLTWVRELLEQLRRTQIDGFSGVLSALYAADEVVAVHMGIRSGNVLAWCFPTYNRQYKSFSPGLILLTKILQNANDAGIQRVDLGRGPERYKSSFANGDWKISEGVVDARPMNRSIRRGLFQLRDFADSSPWARLPMRYYRRFKQSRAVQREA